MLVLDCDLPSHAKMKVTVIRLWTWLTDWQTNIGILNNQVDWPCPQEIGSLLALKSHHPTIIHPTKVGTLFSWISLFTHVLRFYPSHPFVCCLHPWLTHPHLTLTLAITSNSNSPARMASKEPMRQSTVENFCRSQRGTSWTTDIGGRLFLVLQYKKFI